MTSKILFSRSLWPGAGLLSFVLLFLRQGAVKAQQGGPRRKPGPADTLPGSLRSIAEPVTCPAPVPAKVTQEHTDVLIWVVIGAVLILLLFLSWKMLRAISKKEK